MIQFRLRLLSVLAFSVWAAAASAQTPLETVFTYQGQLEDGGNPASGNYDLRFRLFDALVAGRQVGAQQCADNVPVTDGLFTLALDFGAQFAGQERFLEIDVRVDRGLDCANPSGFVKIAPRQPLTAAPHALLALNADRLDGLDSTAFLQSIPMPLTLSGSNPSSHIISGENTSTAVFSAGVHGRSPAASGITLGVFGQSDSTSGRGVFGVATTITGTNYGVFGQSSSRDGAGFGVWAQGRLGASGTKSFRIDHPDDPANKYLLHYSAESPEVINFYSETVTLDDRGEAVVELPHYFAKINTRPRYQLTAVGAPMPMLHVAAKIREADLSAGAKAEPGEAAPICAFRIAGGAPGGEVSWRVEALRNDRWVQQRGAPVEVEKEGLEKGTYQHPELYGQPPEMGMNYDAERERQWHERPSPPTLPDAERPSRPTLPDATPQE